MTKYRLLLTGFLLAALLFGIVPQALALDLSFHEASFAEIFRVLGETEGLNVLVDSSVQGQGTFQLKNVSFHEALDLISKHSGYGYRLEGSTLLVADQKRLAELESKDVRYVRTTTISSAEVLEALALVLPKDDVYVQPEGGLVVLHGSKASLDRAEELILALDAGRIPEKTAGQGRSLLSIFIELSQEMGLNLVADPSLESKKVYLDVRQQNPKELIRQIQLLIPLKVEITDHTLLVGNLGDQNQERLKVYRLDHADPKSAQEALSMVIISDKIIVDEDRKSLVVRGTDADFVDVDLFLADFDKPAPQVLLEVWVQEMTTDGMRNLGIDWQGLPSFSGGDAPVFMELAWNAWDLVLALRALEEKGDGKLLANPKIATLSGKQASIFVGDRVPIVLTDEEGRRTVEFLEAGINLKVTPRISDDQYITIDVRPEVSTFIWKQGIEYPQIRTREAVTNVRVKDGQPIVIGGLLQEQEEELITQIPFLSQLPILGDLFKWKKTKKNQTEMTIFLIPRIVQGDQGVVNQGFFTPAQ